MKSWQRIDRGRPRAVGAVLLAVAMIGAMASAIVLTAGSSSGTTSVVLANSRSGFESGDGNMVLDATTPQTNTDWSCFAGHGGFLGTASPNCKVTTGATNTVADQGGEIQYVGGEKFDTLSPTLSVGNNPAKDEFTNVASFSDAATNNDEFFYGAQIRSTANGTAAGAVEFDQNPGNGDPNLPGSVSPPTTTGTRKAGDRLLDYGFTGGGTGLTFDVLTWIDSTNLMAGGNTGSGACFLPHDSAPCWGAHDISVTSSDFNGSANQTAGIANALSSASLAVNQFAEFGIDLTAAFNLAGTCESFPQQEWITRSSNSFGSSPEDIELQYDNIQTCGEIRIIKQTSPRGENQAFSFSSTGQALPVDANAGGVTCPNNSTAGIQADGSFCLNDTGNGTKTAGSTDPAQNSAGNTIDKTNVQQGTYTVTEGLEPGGYNFDNVSCSADLTSGSSASTSGETATIHLAPGGHVTCLYTNDALGEIKIVKKTDGLGIDQAFSYTSASNALPTLSTAGGVTCSGNQGAGVQQDGSFCLNDVGDTGTGNSGKNTVDEPNLGLGTYTVTEAEPIGWTLESLVCGTGGSGNTTTRTATITLAAGAVVTCTFTNKAPSGAILITKSGKYKGCTGVSTQQAIMVSGNQIGICKGDGTATAYLGGAGFTVTTATGGAVTGGSLTTSNTTGTACLAGLFWNGPNGTNYTVTENGAPTGYSINTSPLTVTVEANADCGTNVATATPAGFSDVPLTNLTVSASSQQGSATNSTITCTGTGITNSPQGPSASPSLSDTGTSGLAPGVYSCTINVDP